MSGQDTPDPATEAREAVERAAAAGSIAVGGKEKKQPGLGPVRYNLEAFGVAILGAVLLKWFCLEAFAIPTGVPIVYAFTRAAAPLGWHYLDDPSQAAA